jgi:hypothetical protein
MFGMPGRVGPAWRVQNLGTNQQRGPPPSHYEAGWSMHTQVTGSVEVSAARSTRDVALR